MTEKREKQWVFRLLSALGKTLFLLFLGAGAVALTVWELAQSYSDPWMDELFARRPLEYTTLLYAQNDEGDWEVSASLYADQNRRWVGLEEMAPALREAVVAIEDERFFEHRGVDLRRLCGAAADYLKGEASYGGSTITQQLIKNLTKEDERTPERKAREILRALYVERRYGKEEILEYYLNTVYFGYRAYGAEAASRLYFGKSASELDLCEGAALAGTIQSPGTYEPYGHGGDNLVRRRVVLRKMAELGKITEAERRAASAQVLALREAGYEDAREPVTSYFTDAVIADVIEGLQEECGYSEEEAEALLYRGGLRIYTTENRRVQSVLERAFVSGEGFPEGEYEAACVVTNPKNGWILGLCGGRGEKTESRCFSRATDALRQPGSALKPLSVYLPALEEGLVTEGSRIADAPVGKLGGADYPQNAMRVYYGPVTLYKALRLSLNAAPARLVLQLGLENSFDFLEEKLHLTTLSPQDCNLAALSMGALTYGVTVREIVGAYGAIAADGVYHRPVTYTLVTTAAGQPLLSAGEGERACSPQAAYVMRDLLIDSAENGIAAAGAIDGPMGAKTGTSNDNFDKWYVGITPAFAAGLWCGFDEPRNLVDEGVTASVAKLLWREVMEAVAEQLPQEEWSDPPRGLIGVAICPDCGGRRREGGVVGYFLPGKAGWRRCRCG